MELLVHDDGGRQVRFNGGAPQGDWTYTYDTHTQLGTFLLQFTTLDACSSAPLRIRNLQQLGGTNAYLLMHVTTGQYGTSIVDYMTWITQPRMRKFVAFGGKNGVTTTVMSKIV